MLVVSIFTRSTQPPNSTQAEEFLDECGYLDAGKLFSDRKTEDINALTYLGAKYLHLKFIDAAWRVVEPNIANSSQFRLRNIKRQHVYKDARVQFSGRISIHDKRLKRIVGEEFTAIANRQIQPTLYLAPVGVGGHADHILVRDAVLKINPEVILWEDFPYNVATADIDKFRKEHAGYINVFNLSKNWLQKNQAIKLYKSQVPVLFKKEIPKTAEKYYFRSSKNLKFE